MMSDTEFKTCYKCGKEVRGKSNMIRRFLDGESRVLCLYCNSRPQEPMLVRIAELLEKLIEIRTKEG